MDTSSRVEFPCNEITFTMERGNAFYELFGQEVNSLYSPGQGFDVRSPITIKKWESGYRVEQRKGENLLTHDITDPKSALYKSCFARVETSKTVPPARFGDEGLTIISELFTG